MAQLNTIEIETQTNPTASVIWLHGLGANGHDFEPIVPELQLPMGVRFIFPHAFSGRIYSAEVVSNNLLPCHF